MLRAAAEAEGGAAIRRQGAAALYARGHSQLAAVRQLGVQHIVSPGSYHCYTSLDFPVSLGEYKFPSQPDEPAVLFMLRTPCKPGLPARDQYRYGHMELYQTPYATIERNVRDQLGRMLGGTWCRDSIRRATSSPSR